MTISYAGFVPPDYTNNASLAGCQRVFSAGAYGSNPTGFTIVNQIPAMGEFTGAKLIYSNPTAVASTVTTAKVASPAADGNNGSALTWTQALFSGAATAVCPVATGSDPNQIYTLVVSDLVAQVPASSANLLQVRTYFSGAAHADSPGLGELTAFNELVIDKLWKCGNAVGVVADTTGISLTAGQLILPYGVKFYYKKPTITVAAIGGSNMRGQGSTGGAYGMIYQACKELNAEDSSRIYSPYVAARSGSNSTCAYAQAIEIIDKIRPQILVILAASGNDAALDAAAFNAMLARMGDIIDYGRRWGTKIIVTTAAPSSALSAGQNTLRETQNLIVVGLKESINVADVATPLQRPDNSALLQAIYDSGDGTHWNDAGHAVGASVLKPRIKAAMLA